MCGSPVVSKRVGRSMAPPRAATRLTPCVLRTKARKQGHLYSTACGTGAIHESRFSGALLRGSSCHAWIPGCGSSSGVHSRWMQLPLFCTASSAAPACAR